MFDKKGIILIDKENCDLDSDELMILALDAGASDFIEEDDSYEIITEEDTFSSVRETIENSKIEISDAQITMISKNPVKLTDEEDIKNMNKILSLLEADDDVENIYHSWEE